jgi:hypothetical protein
MLILYTRAPRVDLRKQMYFKYYILILAIFNPSLHCHDFLSLVVSIL